MPCYTAARVHRTPRRVRKYTECPKIYRKSVLHLLMYKFAVYLNRCSTDVVNLGIILASGFCHRVFLVTIFGLLSINLSSDRKRLNPEPHFNFFVDVFVMPENNR